MFSVPLFIYSASDTFKHRNTRVEGVKIVMFLYVWRGEHDEIHEPDISAQNDTYVYSSEYVYIAVVSYVSTYNTILAKKPHFRSLAGQTAFFRPQRKTEKSDLASETNTSLSIDVLQL